MNLWHDLPPGPNRPFRTGSGSLQLSTSRSRNRWILLLLAVAVAAAFRSPVIALAAGAVLALAAGNPVADFTGRAARHLLQGAVILLGFTFIVNLPFGYWREGVRKFSPQWFISVSSRSENGPTPGSGNLPGSGWVS